MAEEYTRAVLHRACARAAVALGFKAASTDVLDVLADILSDYVQAIAKRGQRIAEESGHSSPTPEDIVAVFNSMSPRMTSWTELRDFAFENVSQMVHDDGTLAAKRVWHQPFDAGGTRPNFSFARSMGCPEAGKDRSGIVEEIPVSLPSHSSATSLTSPSSPARQAPDKSGSANESAVGEKRKQAEGSLGKG
jgi:histone H3/H4